jgi:hypothetical protein
MGEVGHSGGIGVDIGCGGARESSRQSGRNAEKAAAFQSERGSLPDSASPPPNAPSPATTAPGEGRQRRWSACLCAVAIASRSGRVCCGPVRRVFGSCPPSR